MVGGGQSALETAALLHETGADVKIVMRRPTINWLEPNPERLSRLGQVRRPVNKLCEGWRCAVWNSPAAFRRLPLGIRITKARTVLGPGGAWWLKDRVDGVVDVLGGRRVKEALANGSGVRLSFDAANQSFLEVDHVMAGTGFRVNLARLPFVPQELLGGIATLGGYPTVTCAG